MEAIGFLSLFGFVWVCAFWFIGAIAVGLAAQARGRSSTAWFFGSFFLSPILATLLLIAYPIRPEVEHPPAVLNIP